MIKDVDNSLTQDLSNPRELNKILSEVGVISKLPPTWQETNNPGTLTVHFIGLPATGKTTITQELGSRGGALESAIRLHDMYQLIVDFYQHNEFAQYTGLPIHDANIRMHTYLTALGGSRIARFEHGLSFQDIAQLKLASFIELFQIQQAAVTLGYRVPIIVERGPVEDNIWLDVQLQQGKVTEDQAQSLKVGRLSQTLHEQLSDTDSKHRHLICMFLADPTTTIHRREQIQRVGSLINLHHLELLRESYLKCAAAILSGDLHQNAGLILVNANRGIREVIHDANATLRFFLKQCSLPCPGDIADQAAKVQSLAMRIIEH